MEWHAGAWLRLLVTRPNNGSAGEDQRGREDRYNILLQLIKNDRKIWPVRTPAMEKIILQFYVMADHILFISLTSTFPPSSKIGQPFAISAASSMVSVLTTE